jgi:fructose-bisphosphate aldolase, class I
VSGYNRAMNNEVEYLAGALVADAKGILAADESPGTLAKRFATVGVEPTPEQRRAYREALLRATGLGSAISGVILHEETLAQATTDGVPFARLLADQGIIPGVKVDGGTAPLAMFPGEKVTVGLDGLSERLRAHRAAGARFVKWRAVLAVGDERPTDGCIAANAHALARYAAMAQEAELLPIVEPEVLMDGAHDIDQHEHATDATLREVFAQLRAQHVHLEAMLLKTNMMLSGSECPRQAGSEEVADVTLRCLRRVVPAAVPGIVFLSGGQNPETASANLNALTR